jgi:phage FluMu protein Com
MAIQKFGVANKIKTVVSSEKEFEALRDEIVNTNNLIRCAKCGKLLAKQSNDMISVKRKDIDIVAKVADIKIKCPVCGTCNETVKE